MKLNVENEPEIESGDVLRITPDVGAPHKATVKEIVSDRKVKCRVSTPYGNKTMMFYRDELEESYIMCNLMINPE